MFDDCTLETLVEIEPRDPVDVIVGAPSLDHLDRILPPGLRPEGSAEVAWRLVH